MITAYVQHNDSNEFISSALQAFLSSPSESSCKELSTLVSPWVHESLSSFVRLGRYEERPPRYSECPAPSEKDTVTSCAFFERLLVGPEEELRQLSTYHPILQSCYAEMIETLSSVAFEGDHEKELDLAYQTRAIDALDWLLPYWCAAKRNPVMSFATLTLQYLLTCVHDFERHVTSIDIESPGRSKRVKLVWALRAEIMVLVNRLGNQYCNGDCKVEELQHAMESMTRNMLHIIKKADERLQRDAADGLFIELDNLTLRLDFILSKQPAFLKGYSDLLDRIDEFDSVVFRPETTEGKREVAEPLSRALKQHVHQYCSEVLQHIDHPEERYAVEHRAQSFRDNAVQQIQSVQPKLSVHRHPEQYRIGLRVLMGIIHFATLGISYGLYRAYHHYHGTEPMQLFHLQPPKTSVAAAHVQSRVDDLSVVQDLMPGE